MSMHDFLAKEAAVGGLGPTGLKLPANDTHLWGNNLWHYLSQAADLHPDWSGKVATKTTQRAQVLCFYSVIMLLLLLLLFLSTASSVAAFSPCYNGKSNPFFLLCVCTGACDAGEA